MRFLFLDLLNVVGPKQYCNNNHGGGGDGNMASTSGTQQDESPELDLTLSL